MQVKCSAPLWNGALQFTPRDSGSGAVERKSSSGPLMRASQNAFLYRESLPGLP